MGDLKARQEQERKAEAAADLKARQEQERKAKAAADLKAKQEQERKVKAAADLKVKQEEERRTSKSGDESEETDEIGWDDDEGWGDDDDDDDAWDEPVTVKTAVQVKHEAEDTVEATEESSPAGAASAAVVTAPVLPRAREHTQKKKKGMSIAVSSCRSSKKQKPLFEEDTSDAMDLFGSMGLGSALDTALKTDKTKVSAIISTVKRA